MVLDSNDEQWDIADDLLAYSLIMNVVILTVIVGAVIVWAFWRKVA